MRISVKDPLLCIILSQHTAILGTLKIGIERHNLTADKKT